MTIRIAALMVSAALAAPMLPASTNPAVVHTDAGAVRGTVTAKTLTFQGIPYAAPPVGDLRWRSPQPAKPWSGVRDATRPGNDCPQTAGFLGDAASLNEDCLFLNVTTPRHSGSGPLPVVVFVHGGGFYSGSARLYGAQRLADQGDVMVVTPNYRLGVFGFLAEKSLGGDQSGDFGLEDQQAALRWVQRNATAFGGDPRNVTLAGESAGSASTCAQLAAPSSRGLFQRAIMDSAPCAEDGEWPYADGNWYARPRSVAYQQGAALAADLGCADAACLRRASVATLLDKSFGGQGYGPAYGGGFLPVSPAQAIASGRFANVPVIHGTTRDEHRLFVAAIEDMSDHVTTASDYSAEIESVLGAHDAARVLAEYPLSDFASPSVALATVWTDRAWACPALRTDEGFARKVPTFAFEFADENAPWASDVAKPDFPTGAFHAAELQYVFEDAQFPGPVTAAQRKLSDQMIGYWSAFAHSGDPNSAGAPRWNRFQPATGAVQSLAPGRIGPIDLGAEHRCGFWSTIGN
jgi:para-nitrobenzyl esterase